MPNDDLFYKFLKEMEIDSIFVKAINDSLKSEKQTLNKKEYKSLEHSHYINTSITDADMLKVHIDIALSTGNKELFMELTKQLQKIS